jgi:hypothetical protein
LASYLVTTTATTTDWNLGLHLEKMLGLQWDRHSEIQTATLMDCPKVEPKDAHLELPTASHWAKRLVLHSGLRWD